MWFVKFEGKNLRLKKNNNTRNNKNRTVDMLQCPTAAMELFFLNLRAVLGVGDVEGNHGNGAAGMCTFTAPPEHHTPAHLYLACTLGSRFL